MWNRWWQEARRWWRWQRAYKNWEWVREDPELWEQAGELPRLLSTVGNMRRELHGLSEEVAQKAARIKTFEEQLEGEHRLVQQAESGEDRLKTSLATAKGEIERLNDVLQKTQDKARQIGADWERERGELLETAEKDRAAALREAQQQHQAIHDRMRKQIEMLEEQRSGLLQQIEALRRDRAGRQGGLTSRGVMGSIRRD